MKRKPIEKVYSLKDSIHWKTIFDLSLSGSPPSTNTVYRRSRYGRMHMSKSGKEYKERVEKITRLLWKKKPTTGILRYSLDLYFPDNKRRDNANFEKVLLDAIEGIVFKDDKQFKITQIEKHKDSMDPRTEIVIDEYLPTKKQVDTALEDIRDYLGLVPEKEFSRFCKKCPILYYWAVEGVVPSEGEMLFCQNLMRKNREHECPHRPSKKINDIVIGEGLDKWE